MSNNVKLEVLETIVGFLIVNVPAAEEPIVRPVAAPKIVAVVADPNTAKDEGLAEANTVAKPVEPLIVVAFGKSMVAFLIVPVPEVAPIVNAAAAPNALIVVAVALNNVRLVVPVATVGLSIVNVPEAVVPKV